MEFVIRLLKVVRLLMPRTSQTCHMPRTHLCCYLIHTHRHVYTETSNHFEFMTTQKYNAIMNSESTAPSLSYIFPWLKLCRLTSHSSFTRSFLFFPSFILSLQLFSPLFAHICLHLIYNSFIYLFI